MAESVGVSGVGIDEGFNWDLVEYHGEPFSIQWQALLGYGYNSRGDVAIGGMPAKKGHMHINGSKSDDHRHRSCKINF